MKIRDRAVDYLLITLNQWASLTQGAVAFRYRKRDWVLIGVQMYTNEPNRD